MPHASSSGSHSCEYPRAARRILRLALVTLLALVALVAPTSLLRPGVADADGRLIRRSHHVAPGLVLERLVGRHPPMRAFVLRIGLDASVTTDVALADGRYPGYRTTKRIAEDHGAIAAINGDLAAGGRPLHPFAKDGRLVQSGLRSGYAFAVSADGSVTHVGRARPSAVATAAAVGTVPIRDWNSGVPGRGALAAFTPVGGRVEYPPTNACSAQLTAASGVVNDVQPYAFQQEHVVRGVACDRSMPVGSGVVLSARAGGAGTEWLTSLASGQRVVLRWSVGWMGVLDLQGGNPLLLKDGRVVAPRRCSPTFCGRHPRSGVGASPGCLDQVASTPCTVLYVVVDGRRRGWSSGLTLAGFARLFRRLGAARALNLDGGASSTMVVRGRVVNRPSDGSLRGVESAMLVVPNPQNDAMRAVTTPGACCAERPCRA